MSVPASESTFRFPVDIEALDHADLGRLRLVLPITTPELGTWDNYCAIV